MVFGCPFLASWQSENDETISKFCLKGAYDQLAMFSMGTDKEGLTCVLHVFIPWILTSAVLRGSHGRFPRALFNLWCLIRCTVMAKAVGY